MRELVQKLQILLERANPKTWEVTASEGDCERISQCPRGLIHCDDECPKCNDWSVYSGAWLEGPRYIECGDYSYFKDEEAELIVTAINALPELLGYLERILPEECPGDKPEGGESR